MKKILIFLFLIATICGVITVCSVNVIRNIIKTHHEIRKIEGEIRELKIEIEQYKRRING